MTKTLKSAFAYFASYSILLCFSLSALAQQQKPNVPSWVRDAVFYEIYPQTFYDTNSDGIGDLKGIIQKLDYVKSLGVSAIWLNPFYESPFRDAGYDVSDYYKVAPRYGTLDDIKQLLDGAHKRGLKVIFDFVPGHTSIDHPWFKASQQIEPNKYSNWYVWTNSAWDNGGKEFAGKMIHGFSERNGNFLNNFFWHQPALNFGFGKPDPNKPWQLPANHPDVLALKAEMTKVMRYWLDLGADGFRIDMAGSLTKNDPGSKECIRWWKEIRSMLDRDYPQSFIVAEWSYPPHALEGGFHADFLHWTPTYEDLFRKENWRSLNGISADGKSYFDRKGEGDVSGFIAEYMRQYKETKTKGFISIPVGNHDLSRININRNAADLEIIYAFLLTMPGVPFFYYGDEIGMRQLDVINYKEGCYKPRSGARTPMQWTAGKNAGFSEGAAEKLWLPVDPSPDFPNVEQALKSPSSIIHATKKLFQLRRSEKALAADAEFVPLYAEKNKYPFVFSRKAGNETVIVALNPAEKDVEVKLPAEVKGKVTLLSGAKNSISNKTGLQLKMKGASYSIYRIKN